MVGINDSVLIRLMRYPYDNYLCLIHNNFVVVYSSDNILCWPYIDPHALYIHVNPPVQRWYSLTFTCKLFPIIRWIGELLIRYCSWEDHSQSQKVWIKYHWGWGTLKEYWMRVQKKAFHAAPYLPSSNRKPNTLIIST